MAGPNDPVKPDAKQADMIVVDLGAKSAKQVKRLRKGEGKLIDKVKQCLDELRAAGKITGAVQPVVFVVEEEAASFNFMRMLSGK